MSCHVVRLASSAVLVLATALGIPAESREQDKPRAFTDPKQAGVDYELQGEYAGELQTDEGKLKIGVQVIALGGGKFRAVGYIGGLPGDGWIRDNEPRATDGERQGESVQFVDGDITAELRQGVITVINQGNVLGELSKVQRQSPTLGAKPPAGAIVLFDGSHTDQLENGELVEGSLLGATNCFSKQKFGDHSLHIEFRTPFMPDARGQARGNSGVYVHGRYEVQVLDSFGLEGLNNECGGIYSIAQPLVNMCFPPLSWQTYDMDFTAARYDDAGNKTKNARITVKHNGVVIHDNLELTHGTPGRHPEGPGDGELFLQNHGDPVVFANIWVVPKK